MARLFPTLAFVAVTLAAMGSSRHATAGDLVPATMTGSNPGALQMFEYVPAALPAGAPLVVVMHGCSQTAADFAVQAGWLELADRYSFAVVAPQQTASNNSSRCFNWFLPGDSSRDQGEILSIRQMVDQMIATRGVDASQVFVTGLSAGGYMTSIALAIYPERFTGGAVIAGGPFGCATNVTQGWSCAAGSVDRTPAAWASLVQQATSHPGPWPRISIWHGTSDTTVYPSNARELVEQWTAVHGLSLDAGISETVAGHPRVRYGSGSGAVESITIAGMGHGVAVFPGTGADRCGIATPFAVDVGICSSLAVLGFWGLLPPGPGEPIDAGSSGSPDAGATPSDGGMSNIDAGSTGGASGCGVAGRSEAPAWLLVMIGALAIGRRRRRR